MQFHPAAVAPLSKLKVARPRLAADARADIHLLLFSYLTMKVGVSAFKQTPRFYLMQA